MEREGRAVRAVSGELVTIGEFARLSRLSAKALRRYDELGLLRPALVDPVNGYRYYDPAQAEGARLVAWLRRIGMPLSRIGRVVALDAGAAAVEIRAYWARVEAETAARRDLAMYLVDHLSAEGRTMTRISGGTWDAGGTGNPGTTGGTGGAGDPGAIGGTGSGAGAVPLAIRCAALTDTGTVRTTNQDAAFAGPRLLAVADGFGAGGAEASAAAIEALKPSVWGAREGALSAADLLNALEDTADSASRAVRDAVAPCAAPDGSGTTLTAMLWTGSRLGLVHIGDSRAYLLRGGELFRITQDHSLVQSMIDDGSLTEEEAASHPQRALLLRALVGGVGSAPVAVAVRPDVRLREVRAGDRYLLCSDGLSAVVDEAELRAAVIAADDPEEAVRRLVGLAREAGGPDNVACAVADVAVEG
ncbi:protein phosphatase [Streptomyces sp. MnatMP-M77]|uniref:MerR family DNA-binding transcriptional regulator n=1 Tax=unclassified Streptomyces TaxID=2593676 RepID=UPI000805C04E|nr:MerR family transcriptional regulator [Streptomyces sp. MnatMP-M77]MYT81603.1 MerR family DNA-binding transcriptional regulator [Streptomyces sp. SID8364]SBV07285.1 protein phosphatase [Streptomyces sp. MnatMP-M77]